MTTVRLCNWKLRCHGVRSTCYIYIFLGSIRIFLVATFRYPFVCSIGIFIIMALGDSFGTQEVSLVGISLGALGGFMIDTW